MAIRDQRIDVGYGIEKVRRVVYDYRSNPDVRLQTGFVRYDSDTVAVWRPYDPDEPGHGALWQSGLWRNIYVLRIDWDLNAKHLCYQTTGRSVGSAKVSLPAVDVILSHSLRDYIEGLQTTSQP